ncbi:MAG: chorismate synthase [Candidatus Latescibacterota bacterium]
MEILGGPLFAVAGAGESHGPALVTIVFGCPPGLWVRRAEVQAYLDRRRPGSNRLGTPRQEDDRVAILAGLYAEDHGRLLAGPEVEVRAGGEPTSARTYEEGHTTGEPIAAVVLSAAKRSADYVQFAGPRGEVRPGHTDLVKHYKSRGYVDVRGGGRSSYRSTVCDVIGGAVARLFLRQVFGTAIFSSICQVGPVRAGRLLAERVDSLVAASADGRLSTAQVAALEEELDAPQIRTLDPDFAAQAAEVITAVRKEGDSVGAAVEVVAANVPPLVGEPLYNSLKVRLMGALGGLHAAQSCQIGIGEEAASSRGSRNNDPIRSRGYQSNRHGGLIGGITTGAPIVCRVAFKPTATIALPQPSVRKDLEEIEFRLRKGRHDPCVGVRAGVTLESRLAIEVANAVLVHQAGRVDPAAFTLFGRTGDP